MDRITHEMRIANWKSIIEQCHKRPKGQSAKQWLAENNISEKQYYYWQRRLRKAAYDQMSASMFPISGSECQVAFAEVPTHSFLNTAAVAFRPDAVLRTSKVTIELSNTVSDQLLSRIIGGLSHAE